MVSSPLSTLFFVISLCVACTRAAFITPYQGGYDSYCSPQARPVVGGICFDTAFDFKTHFVSSTPGVVMMQSNDLRSIAVPVGASGATMWFTTLTHRVDMVAIKYADWSPYTCVQYTISSTQGKADTRVGHFCPGDAHLRL